jgi:hypothetical protein
LAHWLVRQQIATMFLKGHLALGLPDEWTSLFVLWVPMPHIWVYGYMGIWVPMPHVVHRHYPVTLKFPRDYPDKPPEAYFPAGFFHPNCYPSGEDGSLD